MASVGPVDMQPSKHDDGIGYPHWVALWHMPIWLRFFAHDIVPIAIDDFLTDVVQDLCSSSSTAFISLLLRRLLCVCSATLRGKSGQLKSYPRLVSELVYFRVEAC